MATARKEPGEVGARSHYPLGVPISALTDLRITLIPMSLEVLSRVLKALAVHDDISPSLLRRIYENAKSAKDNTVLLALALRNDVPADMHVSLLALKSPSVTAARLRHMDPGSLHTLACSPMGKKIYAALAQCTNLHLDTVTLLLDKGNALVCGKILVNASLNHDLRQRALTLYVQRSVNLKGKALRHAAQIILSFPEYTETLFKALGRADPLYTSSLSQLMRPSLPWDSKAGNQALVDLVYTFSVALVTGSTETPSLQTQNSIMFAPNPCWVPAAPLPTRWHGAGEPSVIYVRHALANVSKLVLMGVLRSVPRRNVTACLESSLAFLLDDGNKVLLTSQERTHTIGRLADILASLRPPVAKPVTSITTLALTAKSSIELDMLSLQIKEYTNPMDVLAVLSSPHYRHSSSLMAALTTTGINNVTWSYVKKGLEYRSPVSPQVLATMCVARSFFTPAVAQVSVSYIDSLLSFHADPVATLGAVLKILKSDATPAVVALVNSRYFDSSFTHDVPLMDLPAKIPLSALSVLLADLEDPEYQTVPWDVVSLTSTFSKVSLKEALASGKLLG